MSRFHIRLQYSVKFVGFSDDLAVTGKSSRKYYCFLIALLLNKNKNCTELLMLENFSLITLIHIQKVYPGKKVIVKNIIFFL